MGEDDFHVCVLDHESEAFGGEGGVHGDVGRAALEDGEEAGDHVGGALEVDAD